MSKNGAILEYVRFDILLFTMLAPVPDSCAFCVFIFMSVFGNTFGRLGTDLKDLRSFQGPFCCHMHVFSVECAKLKKMQPFLSIMFVF